ncbi:inositol monophosphatase [Halorhabdus sp. CBA1104]|uniref:inositol monophosphatase family protein n=1 Tax=unclassified Halorhabdus TaxID=2621901 RepID=UPI0012B269D6|nr:MULTISPECIES: inositol monophosphatase family protein [unclassified Halorhabdus]QGN06607.1 inositol monophosphatase [Halorhabdus sp. CBA1104]
MDAPSELTTAHESALKAGSIIDDRVGTDFRAAEATVAKESGNDLVTDVDRNCQAAIVETIRDRFPDDRIVGEEDDQPNATGDGREWIVDPIDGTANFATGFPYYCVSIALHVDGDPTVGVVHSPETALGETFYAVVGEGAYCSTTQDLAGEPIHVSDHDTLDGALVQARLSERSAARRARDLAVVVPLLERGVKLRRTASTALNLCQVATGNADGYVVGSSNVWDFAAGELLVDEAGGTVNRRETTPMDAQVIASNGHIQSALEGLVEHTTGRGR